MLVLVSVLVLGLVLGLGQRLGLFMVMGSEVLDTSRSALTQG